MYLLDGLPAMREIEHCTTPAGSCAGMIGGLEVLNGTMLISLFTQGLDQQTTIRALDSFRVNDPFTQRCRYTVDRKGYGLACPSG